MISLQQNQRIANAKRSFVTRRVPQEAMQTILSGNHTPQAGDLVLAKVTHLGHHKRSERVDGRRARLIEGDEVILAYGNRYAPDQFEAVVPDHLGPCHMVAAGGIAATALSWHSRIVGPTQVEPIGLIGDASGKPLNLNAYAEPSANTVADIPNVVVVGTSMNAGKTTSAAHIIYGLKKAGYKVGAMKVTGTGAGGDLWMMQDYGAEVALDFTDAGYPTSFKVELSELMSIVKDLSQALVERGCNAVVVEVADGVYQRETRALLQNPEFKAHFKSVVFTARESLGATAGADWLQSQGYHVPCISGMICASPLAQREAATQIEMPVYGLPELVEPKIAESLLHFPHLNQQRVSA